MPMDRGTPDLVRHCVAAVAKQYGGDTSKAFAICVASLQKSGYLKPGTMELTAAGKKKEKEHEMEPDAAKKMKAYEKLLKASREARKEESYDDLDRLLNPRTRTGLEDTPRAVARKYETVSKAESSMDFMRRMAGITTRYEHQRLAETQDSPPGPEDLMPGDLIRVDNQLWAVTRIARRTNPRNNEPYTNVYGAMIKGDGRNVRSVRRADEDLIIDGTFDGEIDLIRRNVKVESRLAEAKLTPKEEKALVSKLAGLIIKGNEAAEDKFYKSLVQQYGKSVADDITDAAQEMAADDDYGAASDDMDYAQGMGRYAEGRLSEGLEQKLMTALEAAGFDSHDFHFEDGLIAKDMTTALDMTYALAKAGFGVRTGVTLSPVSGKSVKIEFKS